MNPIIQVMDGRIDLKETDSENLGNYTFNIALNEFFKIFQNAETFISYLSDIAITSRRMQALKDEEYDIRRKDLRDWTDRDRTRLYQIDNEVGEMSGLNLEIRFNITPYSHFLDIICFRIAEAVKLIEFDLQSKSVYLSSDFYQNLLEGPSHEAAHQNRYILSMHGYENLSDGEQSQIRIGNKEQLRKGDSHMNGYRNYSVNVQLVIEDSVLKCKMECSYPFEDDLKEELQIIFAPKNPSLGDAIFATRRIIDSCNPEHPLYNEILELITDIFQETTTKPYYKDMDRTELMKALANDINGTDSEWFFREILYPDLSQVGLAVRNEVLRIVSRYVDLN